MFRTVPTPPLLRYRLSSPDHHFILAYYNVIQISPVLLEKTRQVDNFRRLKVPIPSYVLVDLYEWMERFQADCAASNSSPNDPNMVDCDLKDYDRDLEDLLALDKITICLASVYLEIPRLQKVARKVVTETVANLDDRQFQRAMDESPVDEHRDYLRFYRFVYPDD